MEIFNNIQQFFIALITTITTAVMIVLPVNKLQPQLSPTPTVIQEVQEATPTATPAPEVKGINTKEKKATPPPKPEIPKPTPVVSSAPFTYTTPSTPLTSSLPTAVQRQPPTQQPQIKKDYSSYKVALEATLSSLKNRLANIQSSADQLPQGVDIQLAAIENRLAADLTMLESEYNSNTLTITRDYARRGIPISSGMVQNDLNALKAAYDAGRVNLIAKAGQDKQKVIDDAKSQVYQVDFKDKDLSNKIGVVEGLINKINSGAFTDSDILLAIQAMSY